jgi:hypothetical protein
LNVVLNAADDRPNISKTITAPAVGFDKRKPIFVLDEKQGWKILNRRVGGFRFKFANLVLDPRQALPQKRERFIGWQYRQQAQGLP